jgi:hypothetical protein
MNWYATYTKPRQEIRALVNLAAQDYTFYLPQLSKQKLRNGEHSNCSRATFPQIPLYPPGLTRSFDFNLIAS